MEEDFQLTHIDHMGTSDRQTIMSLMTDLNAFVKSKRINAKVMKRQKKVLGKYLCFPLPRI
jgi:hypothetical protein